MGGRRNTGNDSAEILFQTFPREALVSNSAMGRNVHFLMLSIQHFLCKPRRRAPPPPPPAALRGWILERLSWSITCLIHARFRFSTVAKRSSCGPTRKLILLLTQSLSPSRRCGESSSCAWFRNPGSFFRSQQAGCKQGPCVTAVEEDGGDKTLLELELAC